jgi:hypothetical protein
MPKLKDMNDPVAARMLAEGINPEMEVSEKTISDEVMQAAIDSFKHAWTNAKYAAHLKEEILMFEPGEGESEAGEASQLSMEQFAAIGFLIQKGLSNPKGNYARIMRKRGLDAREVLEKFNCDLTPEH